MDGDLEHDYDKLIQDALQANTKHQIKVLDDCCKDLVPLIPEPDPATGAQAADLLKKLRANRRYDQIQMMGEAYVKAGYTTPRIWTIYAQALVDRGNQVAAIGLTNSLLAEKRDEEIDRELSEIHGIRGRAWKDVGYEAINAGRPKVAARALRKSHECYSLGLATMPDSLSMLSWHGTQRVAVAHLARANQIDAGLPDESELAQKIQAAVEQNFKQHGTSTDPWFLTAGGEMCVARNDLAGAMEWYMRAFALPDTDSFTIASTHRQLSQIWRIGGTEAGSKLEALLISEIAKRGGGFALTKNDAEQLVKQLQANIGQDEVVGMAALREAIRSAGSVAMIMKHFRPSGTGFVVDAKSLGLDGPGKVVVTNAHVVSDPPQYDAAVPKNVQVTFELLGNHVSYRVNRIVASLPVGEHDCSVLELSDKIPDEIKALTIGDLPLELPDDPTACVIGHPLGQEISFSFLDGKLVGFEPLNGARPQRMHYRSPTDFGNSGSPVFNRDWDVIGIHRAYDPVAPALNGKAGTYAANEGISLASIKAAFLQRAAAAAKAQVKPRRRPSK